MFALWQLDIGIGIVTGHHVHESFVHHNCAGVNQLRWYVLYREPMISHRVVSLALLRGSGLPCETTKSQYEPIPDQSEKTMESIGALQAGQVLFYPAESKEEHRGDGYHALHTGSTRRITSIFVLFLDLIRDYITSRRPENH